MNKLIQSIELGFLISIISFGGFMYGLFVMNSIDVYFFVEALVNKAI